MGSKGRHSRDENGKMFSVLTASSPCNIEMYLQLCQTCHHSEGLRGIMRQSEKHGDTETRGPDNILSGHSVCQSDVSDVCSVQLHLGLSFMSNTFINNLFFKDSTSSIKYQTFILQTPAPTSTQSQTQSLTSTLSPAPAPAPALAPYSFVYIAQWGYQVVTTDSSLIISTWEEKVFSKVFTAHIEQEASY